MINKRRWLRLLALLFASVLVLSACSDDDDGTTDEATDESTDETTDEPADGDGEVGLLDVEATDTGDGTAYSFVVADSVEAGTYEMSIDNTGAEPHQAQVFKLNSESTFADVGPALGAEDPVAGLLAIGIFDGGTSVVDPGATSGANAVIDLTEGTYVLLCFVENAEGLPHLAAGMVQPFEVTPSDSAPVGVDADAAVDLVDYDFQTPETFTAGSVLELTNASDAEPHEMSMLRLADGATLADLAAFFGEESPAGPPPASSVGGMQALLPGASQKLTLDVEAGEYVLVCFIPSVVDGVPHVEKGMIKQITIE